MRNIILLDWKGNISPSNPEVIKRHQLYGESLGSFKTDNLANLVVITIGNENRKLISKNFILFQTSGSKKNILKFIWSSIRIIRKELENADALVCGDPWETFIVAKTLEFFLGQSLPIQVQVHADISTSEYATRRLRYFIRSLVQSLAFKSAQQIRVVSDSIGKYIVDKYQVSEEKILVIPVPLTLKVVPRKVVNRRTKQVGFIGRLHQERGTNSLIDIISILNKAKQDFELTIVGAGPEQKKLQEVITREIGESRVKFEGWLDQKEIAKILSTLDIYLSLAPSESYGLGIREALSTGVPVLAVKSTGVTELIKQTESSLIHLIRNPLIDAEVIKAYKSALQQNETSNNSTAINDNSGALSSSLAGAWMRLIEDKR